MFLKRYLFLFSVFILFEVYECYSGSNGDNDNEIPRNSRETNDVDPLTRIQDLIRQARTESGDVNLNALLSQNVQDPVPLEDFNISSNIFMSNIHGRFSNLELHGLKSFQLDKLAINLSEMKLSASMSVPMLGVVGDYYLEGTVAFLPLTGEGPFFMNLSTIVLSGHSIVSPTESGRLTMGNVQLDSNVRNIVLHFDNLMGGGTWGSLSNTFINQLSELILGELKPTLLRELSSYLKYQFDEVLFRQLPVGFVDPSSTNMVDSVLDQSAVLMRERGMEPIPLPDYVEVYERRVFFITTRGMLDIYNGTLHGLSTLSRKGDVITVFANNTLVFEAGFELRNLTGSYLWEAGAFGADFKGRIGIQVKSVEGFVRIKLALKAGSKLELDSFVVKEIRHVWLDIQGLGPWDNLMESFVNLVTNGLKLHIADTVSVPVRRGIQEQLDKINVGLD